MATLKVEMEIPGAVLYDVIDGALSANLSDRYHIEVPLAWYRRLVHATSDEHNNFELYREGHYIHWPDLDEHLTIKGLIAGKKSAESCRSFKQWLEARKAGWPLTLDTLAEYERSQIRG